MTPRQAEAWRRVGLERRRREQAETLHLIAMASQGKPEAISKELGRLIGSNDA